jgi:hypothetical protein
LKNDKIIVTKKDNNSENGAAEGSNKKRGYLL